ncbi:MAG: SURF1 family protein [Gammaproteobacteria bacterium]|nr:SURF1 family protein [Gammaproteobacteria bacterium]
MSSLAIQRRFRPGIWPTVAVLILFPLFIRLGVWQLDRAEEKREIIETHESRMQKPRLMIDENIRVDDGMNYRRVIINGNYDSEHQILLDNQIHNGVAGYNVLTPLQIGTSERWVLVNRGWVPLGMSRKELPDIELKQAPVSATGLFKRPMQDQFVIKGGNVWDKQWPQVIQWLKLDEIETELGREFLPYIVLLSPDAPGGYIREWALIASSPEKSESYAVQWFTFAAILLGLYFFLNYKKVQPGER